ncbi:bifunctional DNA-formamidopyrimidine glycosylase/DNA-(apurinic or apyrimidinic site) lyase [Patescibacteria group bacterium]|nr:MAG: bifunctional DNA-formamidopyrimidine glycosylase/DNA-(apurinic or apyrimidinic site) lyase [Patescibacteria group bacterium]
MPELPEVETIRRQLSRELPGKRILNVQVLYSKAIKPLTPSRFAKMVKGAKFVKISRRAKVLRLELANGRTMLVHLKMTGRLLLQKRGAAPRKETEAIFELSGRRALFYDDLRRFGWIRVIKTAELGAYFEKQGYGPEPLAASFTPKTLIACLRAHSGKRIKPLLMDQTCIAGVGNIYADESLWDAGILPTRRVADLTDQEIIKLHGAVRRALEKAIRNRGTSADSYLDAFGREGTNFPRLNAYGQAGTRCKRGDGGIIKKTKLGGRGTHWCLKHQK